MHGAALGHEGLSLAPSLGHSDLGRSAGSQSHFANSIATFQAVAVIDAAATRSFERFFTHDRTSGYIDARASAARLPVGNECRDGHQPGAISRVSGGSDARRVAADGRDQRERTAGMDCWLRHLDCEGTGHVRTIAGPRRLSERRRAGEAPEHLHAGLGAGFEYAAPQSGDREDRDCCAGHGAVRGEIPISDCV